MKALEVALGLAAALARRLEPGPAGTALVAQRTLAAALELADRLRAGQPGQPAMLIACLQNGLAVLQRLEALSAEEGEQLLEQCTLLARLLAPPAPTGWDVPTDCSPALIEEDA